MLSLKLLKLYTVALIEFAIRPKSIANSPPVFVIRFPFESLKGPLFNPSF
jgi:hypothetical protein